MQRGGWFALAGLGFLLLASARAAGAAEAPEGGGPFAPAAEPALATLAGRALALNPGALAQEAAVNAARARERAAAAPLYNPELELEGETAETDTGSVGLRQTIDLTDKQAARARVAGFGRAAAEAELAAVREGLAAELLASLSRFHTAGELDRLSGQRADVLSRFASLAERRFEAGDLGRVDLDLARLAATDAGLGRALAQAALADADQALAAVLGEEAGLRPDLPADLPLVDSGTLDVEALLAGLPAVRAARSRVEAARAAVELRRRERWPDPAILLRGGAEESEEKTDALVGLTLSIPLFVRNPFEAEVEAASADLAQAERGVENGERRARARLLSAAERYRLTLSAWREWQRTGRPSLASQIDLLQRIWQAGEVSTTDYLVQLRQTLDTEANAVELRGRQWEAWFDLLAAAGKVEDWLGLGGPEALPPAGSNEGARS